MSTTSSQNYHFIKNHVREIALNHGRNPEDIQVIAVSKTYPEEAIKGVYQAGCRDFGESRLQEALQKIPHLSKEICWHLIGSLQSNKINKAISTFDLIHSVDAPDLAWKISSASEKLEKTTSILLQVNTSEEISKHGLTGEAWNSYLKELDHLPFLKIEGLMTIAPLTNQKDSVRACFRTLRLLRDQFRDQMRNPEIFRHLSMGMSNDYVLAIEEGATLLRIGSLIFGSRG